MAFIQTSISTVALSLALGASSLYLGGCKAKDNSSGAASSQMEHNTTSQLGEKDIEKWLKVKPRKTNDAEAEKALSLLGLWEPDVDGLSWAKREGEKGQYSYKDVVLMTEDDEQIKVDNMQLSGVHMDGDNASFDRIDMEDVYINLEDTTIKIARLSLSDPTAETAQGVFSMLNNVKSLEYLGDGHIDLDLKPHNITFGGAVIEDIQASSEGVTLSLEFAGWGEDTAGETGNFLLSDFNMQGVVDGKTDVPFSVSLERIAVDGLNMAYLQQASQTSDFGAGPLNTLNPYTQAFEGFSLENFNFNVDNLKIKAEGLSAKSEKKSGVLTTRQTLAPLTVSFAGQPQDEDIAKLHDMVQSLGYEELHLSGASVGYADEKTDIIGVKSAHLTLKDGFKLTSAYEMVGLEAFTEAVQASDGDPSSQADAAMNNLKLKSLDLSLSDESIVERAFQYAAQMQGSSEKVLRMQAKGLLSLLSLGATNEQQAQLLANVGESLGGFLEDGGTLKLSVHPDTPIAMAQAQNLAQDPGLLETYGFSITRTD